MFFKSLELTGFKSFVDSTKVDFESGVTAVVGPNGCGKSNIADGIRWVLGEQSPKTMRGTKMEDFIFNGSATRRPMGYAEVSLTIGNLNGVITSHPYAEYEEITVTRKLYRTGESEYYINKVPCRLKDVVDVFLDTGVSAKTLSIIEQGQVTRIIGAKPEDRRVFIDEAAGIMKYKARRNAARNKLELSQQNLLRVQDILSELERQRTSLNRQAKKAERYMAFREEIKSRALASYADGYQRQSALLAELDAKVEELKEREAALLAELSTRRNELETLAARITETERASGALKEEKGRAESAAQRNEDHRALLERNSAEARSARERAAEEIVQVNGEIAACEEQIASRRAAMDEARGRIGEKGREREELRRHAGDAQESLRGLQEDLRRATQSAREAVDRQAQAQGETASIRAKLEMASARAGQLAQQREELDRADEGLNVRTRELRGRAEEIQSERDRATQALEETRGRLEALRAELEAAGRELSAASDEVTKTASKRESLEELERTLEGYGEGVRALMRMRDEGRGEVTNLRGPLARGVRAAPENETALAAAFGARLESLVAGGAEDVARAIALLKSGNLGAAGFAIADMAPAPLSTAAPAHPALVGRALDLVMLDGEAPAAARALLAATLVARDLMGAMEIWKAAPGAFTVVTLEGEVIDAAGFVTGGPGRGQAAGLVSRRRVIEELQGRLAQLEARRDDARSLRDGLAESVNGARAALEEAQKRGRELELAALSLGNEIQKAEAERGRHDDARRSLEAEASRTGEERSRLEGRQAELAARAEELTRAKEEADRAAGELEARIHQSRDALDELNERLREKDLEVAGLTGKLESLEVDLRRLEESKAGAVVRVRRLADGIRESEGKEAEMRGAIESLTAENAELARRADELKSRVEALTGELEEMSAQAAGMQARVRELQGALDEVQPAASETSLNRSEVKMRLENLIEKADQEFNIPIEDLRAADVRSLNMEEETARLNFLRGEIARIGDVNVSALEEYEQVNQRFEFLKTQRDDLVTSIAHLHKTIESLNGTTEKMFQETFEKVSVQFEAIFKRLFGGGRAEMRLVMEEGKTEPGVEIYVQPPGKKNQSISLLSAGEKAMTAIALLFAVFQTKPSPFCLLDEIDAPLDEANIGRFRDLLMEMTHSTQFIIITHNQKTMGFADMLYGVTQEEEGVSKVLAVSLVDERESVTAA
ncbi:MAG: chromosome segregation protein SMC [Nitrospinae bacterium]|nr:chromosome segregation protein SMC [Nitrospinota bacterium]